MSDKSTLETLQALIIILKNFPQCKCLANPETPFVDDGFKMAMNDLLESIQRDL